MSGAPMGIYYDLSDKFNWQEWVVEILARILRVKIVAYYRN